MAQEQSRVSTNPEAEMGQREAAQPPLGWPAPPRPAGPTSFVFARNQWGAETLIMREARDKGAGTQCAGGRPSGPMEAGRLLSSAHGP